MTKRKLNRRQKWRIEKIQQDKLSRQQRNRWSAGQLDQTNLGAEQEGIIVSHYGQQVEISPTGCLQERFRCFVRANIDSLVAGDRVVWQLSRTQDIGVVVARHPRESELGRPDPGNNHITKPIAANIDQMLIVIAPEPKPTTQLIDRYLIAASTVGITPIILMNKIDLIVNALDSFDRMLSIYRKLGYTVVECSTKTDDGMGHLHTSLYNHTSVFVGQSGVGKSSLINTLLPDIEKQKTTPLSESTGKGQHTTTTARVFFLNDGGCLIDSPGIREFGIWNITLRELEYGYFEIRAQAGLCKFRDCSHITEPKCAVLDALETGKIDPERYQNFITLKQQLEQQD